MPRNSKANLIKTDTADAVHRNLSTTELVEHALRHGDGRLASNGALVAYTGKYTGRTPKDKFVVREKTMEEHIWWENNAEMSEREFKILVEQVNRAMPTKRVYIVDAWAGADPKYRIPVRVAVTNAYHALFIKTMLIDPTEEELEKFRPEWVVADFGREPFVRDVNGEMRDAVIGLHFGKKTILIMGTQYAGEMKKGVFTVMNALLPLQGVMSMHCSANIGKGGDTALFFGLSGTGKTTLSADPDRHLIGDDEHGWTDKGVFNIEGGCYAKCINLSQEGEPDIYNSIKFGSVLENVMLDESREPDYDDDTFTENTRCAYPINYIKGAVEPSVGGHPENIIFLTADAFGVLPPISKLTPEQAMFHFLNGYTAKVAGTEAGVTEPTATFSTCFGAPFLPLRPKVYAELLKKKIKKHGSQVWLVNTGWTGGPYGVGNRMSLSHTRAMIKAALSGELKGAEFEEDKVFGLAIPKKVKDVPVKVLNPRKTWEDKKAYDKKAAELKEMFDANFKKFA